MMILTTWVTRPERNTMCVQWSVGKSRQGVITYPILDIEDQSAVVELDAIKYLLFEMNVLNRSEKLLSGKGLALNVSSPVIKKLVRGKSSKSHLLPYARFIVESLSGIEIHSLRSRSDIFKPMDQVDRIVRTELSADTPILSFPTIGRVSITAHALERYAEYLLKRRSEANDLRKSLLKRLENPNLVKVILPERVLKHKQRKYGSTDNLEVWSYPSSELHLVLLRQSDQTAVLVTVYGRHLQYDY